jgi:GTP-binding protein
MEVKFTEYLISNPDVKGCPKADKPEIAFIGRSNVGKSSLINMLSNKKELAKISSSPGKTQLINHFLINKNMYWVDLPGYGFAKVSQAKRGAWTKMIWNYVEQRTNLMTLFVLVDSRHTPQKMDLEFVNKLGEKGIPFTIVFTKADKESQKEVAEHVAMFKRELLKTWEALPTIFITSSVKRLARKEMLDYIGELSNDFVEVEVKKEDETK